MALYLNGKPVLDGYFPIGTVNSPAIRSFNYPKTGIFWPAADTLAIATGGTERVRVDSSEPFTVTLPGVGNKGIKLLSNGGTPNLTSDGNLVCNASGGNLYLRAQAAGYVIHDTGLGLQISGGRNLLINAAAAYADNGQLLEVNKSADDGGIGLFCWSATDAERALIEFHKSSSATIGTKALVADEEAAGGIIWKVADGAVNWSPIASIEAFVDTAPGAGDTGGRIVLSTTADGAATVTNALWLDSSQRVGIGVAPSYPLTIKGLTAGAQDIFGILADDNGSVCLIGKDGNDNGNLSLYTGAGSEVVVLRAGSTSYINTGQNFGLGIAAPRAALDIAGGYLVGTGLQLPHVINKAASANVRNSHDAEATTQSATYVKLKTITITNGLVGQARFLFDLKTSDSVTPTTATARIYRNGVALGTEQTDITGGYVTKSEDLTQTWNPGDTAELWAKIGDVTDTCYVQNFRIAYDDSATIAVASANS